MSGIKLPVPKSTFKTNVLVALLRYYQIVRGTPINYRILSEFRNKFAVKRILEYSENFYKWTIRSRFPLIGELIQRLDGNRFEWNKFHDDNL